MKKKKILFCDNSLRSLLNFRGDVINSYVSDGFEVILVAPETCRYQPLQTNVHYIPIELSRSGMNPIKEFKYLLTLYRIYQKEHPDYIFHYTIKPNIYGSIAAKICHIPTVAMVTGLGYTFNNKGIGNMIARLLYRWTMRFPQYILVLNAYNRDLLLKEHMAKPEQLILLSGGEGINLSNYF